MLTVAGISKANSQWSNHAEKKKGQEGPQTKKQGTRRATVAQASNTAIMVTGQRVRKGTQSLRERKTGTQAANLN